MTDKDIDEIKTQLGGLAVDIREIKTVLLGVPNSSDGGLVAKLKDLGENHERLSRNFTLLVGILAGSGIVTGSIWGVLQVIK